MVLLLWLHTLLHCIPISKQCCPGDMQLQQQGQPSNLLCRAQPVFSSSCSLFQQKSNVEYENSVKYFVWSCEILWNITLSSQTFISPLCHPELPLPSSILAEVLTVLEIIFTPSFYSCLWWWRWWCPFFCSFVKKFETLFFKFTPYFLVNTASEYVPVHP